MCCDISSDTVGSLPVWKLKNACSLLIINQNFNQPAQCMPCFCRILKFYKLVSKVNLVQHCRVFGEILKRFFFKFYYYYFFLF